MREDVLKTQAVLAALPLLDRIAALCCSLLHEEPKAAEGICVLVEVAAILTRQLPEAERTRVAWHLGEVIERLRVRWQ
jgi:hypothetical protein